MAGTWPALNAGNVAGQNGLKNVRKPKHGKVCRAQIAMKVLAMNKETEFLKKLNQLLQEYKAEIGYTIDDDGIHISVDGKTCFVGWLDTAINDLAEKMTPNA